MRPGARRLVEEVHREDPPVLKVSDVLNPWYLPKAARGIRNGLSHVARGMNARRLRVAYLDLVPSVLVHCI